MTYAGRRRQGEQSKEGFGDVGLEDRSDTATCQRMSIVTRSWEKQERDSPLVLLKEAWP